MEMEIRRDRKRGRGWEGVKTGEKEGGKRYSSVCPVTSCNQNAFSRKYIAEREGLSHRLEYIYLANRHPPTVKQAPQLQ